jgi:Flp pilus assembly protein TadG
MRARLRQLVSRFLGEESGQMLPWVALLSILFLGMAGMSLDLGNAYVAQRELQASTDAAVMAGAQSMWLSGATTASVTAAVQQYSSVSGNYNASGHLNSATVVSVKLACNGTFEAGGIPCIGPGGTNMLQVKQSATVPTVFVRMLGLFGVAPPRILTVGAVSTATIKGGTNAPYNVALVIDTTGTMLTSDNTCGRGGTRLSCALQGAQTLLKLLNPCAKGTSGASCTPFDSVSIFTFPAIQANTAGNDTSCPSISVTTANYYAPTASQTWTAPTGTNPTYQITSYLSDYTSGSQISDTSDVGAAVDTANCGGLRAPNGRNGDNYKGTFYAGAIYAAADSLYAAYNANKNSYNSLIILSDGDASACYQNSAHTVSNFSTCEDGSTYGTQMDPTAFASSSGSYPSYMDQCQQGIQAANYAKSIPNTTVFTISYGSPSSGCATDTSNAAGINLKGLTPCKALLQMASSADDFFTDADSSNPTACTGSSTGSLSTSQIFQTIWLYHTSARLQPNSTFPSS